MHFVLVHGGWADGAAWDATAGALRALGHGADAPTLAGHGKKAARNVSHGDCVDCLVRYVEGTGRRDIVLVGHSFGGSVVARAAPRLADRLRRLVFLNAFIPADGNSVGDENPPHLQRLFADLAAASGDGTVTLPFPVWREAFMNDADVSLARETYAALNPEPAGPIAEKLDLSAFYGLETPRSFLYCTEDTALPQGEWGFHPRMSNRLGLFRLVTMPGGHCPMLTDPVRLAAKLVEAGRD